MSTDAQRELSDKALAVFAFAAFHQLSSGQPVTTVVRADGSGHEADPDAVEELSSRDLAVLEGNAIRFTDDGLAILSRAVERLRGVSDGAGPGVSGHDRETSRAIDGPTRAP